jgi:hypothetical protein
LAITERKALFDDTFLPAVSPHANYDVSLDGSQFLMLKGGDENRIVVVHSWGRELRARLSSAADRQ